MLYFTTTSGIVMLCSTANWVGCAAVLAPLDLCTGQASQLVKVWLLVARWLATVGDKGQLKIGVAVVLSSCRLLSR